LGLLAARTKATGAEVARTSKTCGTWSETCLFVCGPHDGSPPTTQSNTSHGEWQVGEHALGGVSTALRATRGGSHDALRLANVGPGQRVSDVGAGTGVLSPAAATLGAEVLATDFSPGMVDYRKGKTNAQGIRNVQTVVMGRALSGRSFSLAAAQKTPESVDQCVRARARAACRNHLDKAVSATHSIRQARARGSTSRQHREQSLSRQWGRVGRRRLSWRRNHRLARYAARAKVVQPRGAAGPPAWSHPDRHIFTGTSTCKPSSGGHNWRGGPGS